MDTILILDFGSQYTLLIVKKLRKLNTPHKIKYIEPDSATENINVYFNNLEFKSNINFKGIILSGKSGDSFPLISNFIFKNKFFKNKPILGVGLGAQILASNYQGSIKLNRNSDYVSEIVNVCNSKSKLLKDIPKNFNVWIPNNNNINIYNQDLVTIKGAGMRDIGFEIGNHYGILFHPEVRHTDYGTNILNNFIQLISDIN